MPTNDELRNFIAGKIPLQDAEEIDRQVRESPIIQARVSELPADPMVVRLRKVWQQKKLAAEEQAEHDDRARSAELVVVDRYCLIEIIGSGGMGQVWRAKPLHGAPRTVALKLVKPGLDSKSIIERFELERKALAMMDHPCIAKVLDGGATDQGQSYFVMELVDGAPITTYCDDHQLGIKQRLELFAQVCRAVQHAHQKGIIHRDLKPSNILITPYDGRALPKIIDFGLAKAFGGVTDASDHSQVTEYGALVGTVRYMSPEQVELNSWDIDTRSDIYSLGVVLYELLTGTTPTYWSADSEPSLFNMLQAIRDAEPPKPSVRLSATSTPAAAGQLSSRAYRHILRHDLDWIVMKAIEKNRERRYETADALAQDIDRYLTGQPVAARPPSTLYRLGKFVKKHRGSVSMAVAVFMMVVAGVISWVWSARADIEKHAVLASASYGSMINELNVLSASRHSGWTHRGLGLVRAASARSTPLRDTRQLRDWAAMLLTIPDVDMTLRSRFVGDTSPTDITYSPSGRRLAVGLATNEVRQRLTIILIDLETEKLLRLTPELSDVSNEPGSDQSVTSLRFAPNDDDTLYVGTRNGKLLRIDLEQSPPAVICKQASRGGVLVRLSGDGRYCVTATSRQQKQQGDHDERVRCFDATTLDELGVSEANQRVRSLSISPDSSRACINWDSDVESNFDSMEYTLPDFQQIQTWPGRNAEYHPLGHSIFTGEQAIHKRLNLETRLDTAIYMPGTALAWTPHRIPTFQDFQVADKGALLTSSSQADHCIFFWREAASVPFMSFRLSGNRNISGYSLSPTMDTIAVLTDDALEVYNFTDRAQYCRVVNVQTLATHFAVAPDQREFASLVQTKLCRYDLPDARTIDTQTASLSELTRNALAYAPNNRALASTRVMPARALEIVITHRDASANEKVVRVPSEPAERFDAPKMAGLGWIDSKHLVAAVDFRLLVVNTESGQLESASPQHNPHGSLPSYRAIAFRINQCVTIDEEGLLDVWHLSGKELVRKQSGVDLNLSTVERLAWHPHEDYVVVGTRSGSLMAIDLKLGKPVFMDDKQHAGEICGAAWCDQERLVTASRDGKLVLWQKRGDRLKPYTAWDTRSGIIAIDVSTDGKTCYVATAGESISIFNLAALDAEFERLGIAE